MRRQLSATLICVALLTLSRCTSDKNLVKVSHTNFTGEIEQDQNLVFTFNKKLVPDSLLYKWDTTRYVSISPAVKGKFKWTNVDELIFSPEESFLPSTDYKAVVNTEVLKHSKAGFQLAEGKPITFHTPYLNMVGTQLFYALAPQNTGQVQIRINLSFNCKVRPSVLQKLLHITINGAAIPFDILGSDADNLIGISIPDQSEAAPGTTMSAIIHIDKGLACIGSTYQTKDPLETSAELPVKEKLIVTEMTGAFENGQGVVNVLTNQPVVNENLTKYIKVDPAVTFKIETLESGFKLTGDFQPSKRYSITISENLKGIFGTTMRTDYTDEVSFGELKPVLQFANGKAMYISSMGEKNIAINIAAIQKVKVTVSKVYENNILEFIRSGKSDGYSYESRRGSEEDNGNANEDDDDEGGHDYAYYNLQNYGDAVFNKVYNVQSLPKLGNLRLLNLSLEDLDYSSSFKGVYIVTVADTEHRWLQTSTIVSMSDIGLIAKQGRNKIMVFANSILKAKPISGVKVDFISTNNQKVISAVTDEEGVASISDIQSKLGQFRVGMITCMNGEDFNFMILDNTEVETSRYDVGGKISNAAHLDDFLYGDRDLYRPGDSIHLNVIVRDDEWSTVKDVPVKLRLMLPNGKEYQSQKRKLDAQGAATTDFYLPPSIITGSYNVQLLTANDILIDSKDIEVEEFMPDRIKVTVTLDKDQYTSSDSIKATVKAENYFGPPASDRNYEINLTLKRREFYPKKYNDYTFRLKTSDNTFQNIERNGKTDKDGTVKEYFPMPNYKDYGILQGNVYATVFDETGRPVHRLADFQVITQDVFYGIQDFDYWVNTNVALNLRFAALDINEKAVAADAQVEIYRYNWETILQRRGSHYEYESQRKEQLLYSNKMKVTAEGGTLPFTPTYSGDYEIRIRRPGSDSYVAREFYAYGYGYTQNTSFEVSNEGEVTLAADKDHYKAGEKAKILIKSPFNGRVLITVERGDVYEYYFKETDNKSASVTIDLTDDYVPNVYITATAIRDITGPSLPLTIARGFIPIKVEKPEYKMPVKIIAKESVRSKTTQTITIKSVPGAEVTVAAVDEGILAIRNYKTPDPYAYFYAQKALGVSSYDLYPFLFPELQNHQSTSGGDMDEKGNQGKRVNPLTNKRVVLLAKWSGILPSNGNGEATYTINIPQFSGSVRIMAVAYKDKTFGSAEKDMIVADPVVISTALPRFTSPGDSLIVPVTLSNTTAHAADLSATITSTAPLYIIGKATQSVQVGAKGEARVTFKISAKSVTGISNVVVTVSDGKEKFTDETEISCRPLSSLQKVDDDGVVKAGDEQTLSITAPFIPSTMDAKLIISKSPMVQFTKDLRYLIEYPYGCVEQTVSTAFPQLYYNDIAAAIGQNGPKRYNPDYNVREAIKKLESMQLYNGAFSYWPGGDYESWWGSAYAVHFLLEADKAGFDVNKTILNKALAYLQFKVRNHDTYTYYYWDEHGTARSRVVLDREIVYSLYVLALAGKYDISTMNFCKSDVSMLTLDSKYMLACTYALSGNIANYKALLPDQFKGELSQGELAGSFSSPIRDEAIALNCMLETQPDDPQVGVIAMHLSSMMKKQRWMNTQEESFCLLALGKIAHKAAKSNITADVIVDGQSLGQFTGKELVIKKGVAGKKVIIKTNGTGSLYYSWELEGISNTGSYKEEDKNLKVRRSYYDKYGHIITGNSYHQNDLIIVKVTLQAAYENYCVPNVAITDLLPAGFEIENPRISSVPELVWIKDANEPDYIDIRDDRINLFATAYSTPRNYYYIVRAVSKGKFKQGPIHADAMYSMDYHSDNGGGTVIVK